MSNRVFFAGNSLEQALVKAASHYDLEPNEVSYERVEKRHGFLKQGKSVVIRVDPDHPRRAAPESRRSPAPPAPEVSEVSEVSEGSGRVKPTAPAQGGVKEELVADVDGVDEVDDLDVDDVDEVDEETDDDETDDDGALGDDFGAELDEEFQAPLEERVERRRAAAIEEPLPSARAAGLVALPAPSGASLDRARLVEGPVADAAGKWLDRLLALASLDLSAELWEGDGKLEVELAGPDQELVVEDEGQVLRAIQHLLPRLMMVDAGALLHLKVDCDRFQEIREERLRDLAHRAAAEVRSKGRPKTLQPMHPADRRVVHLALADDPAVETESVGAGYYKRVMVRSA